jgi:CMP-N,N'-diacetyllegionaminic acid synthase
LILGIVPARAGSKRLPGKNCLPLCGKPLVSRAIEVGLESCHLDHLVVSTDDPEVMRHASTYPSVTVIERPAEFSHDQAPAIDYVRHAIRSVEGEKPHKVEVVVIIQPSSPFTQSSDIDGTIDLLLTTPADSAVSIVKLDHALQPAKLKKLGEARKLLPYLEEEAGRMSPHQLPELYIRNGSVYASRRSTVERGDLLGVDSRGFLMPRERSLDINDRWDFEMARFMSERVDGAG